MPLGENEPPAGSPARRDPDEAAEVRRPSPDPDDDFFSSGSFSPVTVQIEDEKDAAEDEADEAPRRRPAPDDSPRVLVQLGEDPGVVVREDPDDA